MKKILVLAASAVLLVAADSQAQSKTGTTKPKTESPRSNTFKSAESPEKNIKEPTNVSQTRDYELERENGYYQMPGERDWGTNAQLNGFPYPVINPGLHPEAEIDTSGHVIQSGLYDNGGNASGYGVPVRKMVDQDERARRKAIIDAEKKEEKTEKNK